ERRREQRKRVARRLGLEPAGAAARPAHEHRRSDRRCEEDELLAERVEAAVVEDDRADDIRRVALVNGDAVEQQPVATVEVTEVRQAAEAPDEETAERRAPTRKSVRRAPRLTAAL